MGSGVFTAPGHSRCLRKGVASETAYLVSCQNVFFPYSNSFSLRHSYCACLGAARFLGCYWVRKRPLDEEDRRGNTSSRCRSIMTAVRAQPARLPHSLVEEM
jgi:hypothetical protein